MKKPCDRKKRKGKQHLFRFCFFMLNFIYFFCYWKIHQSRPTIVLKQMDFAAFTSKRHLKSTSRCLTGGRWEGGFRPRITSQTKVFVTSSKESRRAKNSVP